MYQIFNRRQTVLTILGCIAFALSASAAKAATVFVTPPGTTIGGLPVSAQATFSQSGNILTITLQNFQANPVSIVQTISGLKFTIVTAGGTLTSSSADHIDIAAGGTFTNLGVSTTDWLLTSSGGNYFLNGLGSGGPDEEIIGPTGGGGTYSNANGSIIKNDPHNPFLNQTATFTLTIPGLPPNAVISNVIFQFGTGTDSVNGTPGPVPEPASMLLLGTGLLGLAGGLRHRRRSGK